MSTVGDRIVELIEALHIKKGEFADRLRITPAFVSQICSGVRQPSDRTISDICEKFGVSRSWLEDGIEPMFPAKTDYDIEVVMRAMRGSSENKKKLIRILAEMPDELLDKMMDYLKKSLS